MSVDIATATLLASLAISTLAVLVSLWAVLQTRQAQQVAAYRSVHELYDKMVELKFENPDFLITARDWDPSKMRCVFTPGDPEQGRWSRYYTFVELCIGFSNAVLQAHECQLMGDKDYDKQWERLVRLVVAEHYPIISGFAEEGPYLSEYLRDYLTKTEKAGGWDWTHRHRALQWAEAGQVGSPAAGANLPSARKGSSE